jgi:uncharacterized membrane protein YqjE
MHCSRLRAKPTRIGLAGVEPMEVLGRIFNFQLLGNPANWLIVFAMIALPMLLVTVIHARTTQNG